MADSKAAPAVEAGIRALLELTDTEFEALDEVLSADRAVWRYQWVARLAVKLPRLSKRDVGILYDVIYAVARSWLVSSEEMDAFLDRAVAEVPDGVELDLTASATLRGRLAAIMVKRHLLAATRASEIFGSERVIQDIRIVEDLRPIFVRDDADPVGYMLLFDLQFDYAEGGATGTIRLRLDEDDLAQLKEALAKADSHREAMERTIAAKNLPYFRIEPR